MLFLCVLLALTVTIKGYCHDLNICRKHGSDRGLASHYFYNACTCNAGYAGECCEAEKNECESFPCMNGGTCTDLFNDYTCTCSTGDSGKNCEFHYDITDSPRIILPSIKVISEGTNLVKIPCFAEGIPIPHVTWEAVDGNLPSNVKQIAHYLIIQNVTVTDTAFYSCTANNRDGVDIKVVHVLVNAIQPSLVAPVITVPQNLIVKYYTEAEVVCKATGNPKPDIKWEYDHNRNVSAVLISGGTLRIPNATNVASGLYTCIASNDAGSAKAFVRLEVVHDPPSIVFPPQPFGGSAGVPQNFTCEASGHPHPRITWTFTSFSHQTSGLPPHTLFQNGEVLEIINVQESGTVACEAINEFGKDTASASIIVHHDTAVVG